MLTRRTAVLYGAALSAFGPLAAAQSWPTRPVTVLAPFAAGGTVDIVARLVGIKLGKELGQSIVVENRGGAGGTIATGMLARAAPDGHTLMIHHQGMAFNASLYEKLPYDTVRDILPVAHIGVTPNVLVVNNSLPVKSVAEFLSYARTHKVHYGSGGLGSAGHLPMELMQSMTGVRVEHVPYKGSGPAINDLMSGHIQAMLLTIPAVMPYIQSGKLRAIATSGKRRSPALPDLPTLDEAGVKGFEYLPWYGFFAPAKTPDAVVQKLHAAVYKVLTDPEVAAKLGQQGLEVQPLSRERFAGIVNDDVIAWGKIIRTLGLKVE